MNLDEELALVDKAKSDIRAFEMLYEFYYFKILAYIRNRLPNKETSEDLTAEVFIRAVENVHNFDTSKRVRFGSWLYRTAGNIVIDYIRTNKVSVDSEIFNSIESEDRTEDLLEKEERQKIVSKLIVNLKPRYQEIISLKFFLELEDHEIAEVMKIKINNVYVTLHRALKSFEREFKRNFREKV